MKPTVPRIINNPAVKAYKYTFHSFLIFTLKIDNNVITNAGAPTAIESNIKMLINVVS